MNKFVAVLLSLAAVAVIVILGWGMIYLPGTMSASAKRAIEDIQLVLARDAPGLTLTHGAISADPLTASVAVAEISLSHSGGNSLKADALAFTIDPFSGEISAVEAQALSFHKGEVQTKVEAISLSGLTAETRALLQEAARGELTMDAVIGRLEVDAFRLRALTMTTPNEGELSLGTIAMENMGAGIVGRFFLEDMNLYVKSGRDPGEITLKRLEFIDLNIGEIVAAVRRPGFLPIFTAPVIKSFTMERFEIHAKDIDLVVGRGTSDAIYATNDDGRTYAQKMNFTLDGITMKPRGKSPALDRILLDSGLDTFKARFNFVTSGDHVTRTMAVEKMSLHMDGLANIDFNLRFGSLPKEVFELSMKPEDIFGLMAKMQDATLIGGSLVISNTHLVQLSLAQASRKQGIDAKAMAIAMLGAVTQNAKGADGAFFKPMADELKKFLNDPKTLKFTLAPMPPLRLRRLQKLSKGKAAGRLMRALNLKVEANR